MRGQIVNRDGAAGVFGVAPITIDAWIADGCPAERGARQWKINTADVAKWLRERERKLVLGEISNISEADVRRRRLAAELALIEHELAMKTGAAVAIADWQATLAGVIGNARAKLLALPSKWGPRVAIETDAAVCEALLDEGVREALMELSADEIPDDLSGGREPEGDGPEDAQPMGPAPRPDRKRVGRRVPPPVEREQR